VAYWEGERCEIRLALSHFSELDLRRCRLEWSLEQHPAIRGTFEDVTPGLAQINHVGTIVFNAPPMPHSARVRLSMRLYDEQGAPVARNHTELYCFPRRLATPPAVPVSAPPALARSLRALGYTVVRDLERADLAVVTRMTDELRWFVQNGGRVLWLAEASDSKQAYLGLDIVERQGRRWQGDWANNFNWLRQDVMFREIPSEGMVDFAFADLTPEHVIVGLSPRDFASDVHAGLFVGWIHHTVALIAERRIGDGRLLVSTFRLQQHLEKHPVATIMLHDMIAQLASCRLTGNVIEARPLDSTHTSPC